MTELTCFKTYDVRGKVGEDIDEDIVYRIGRAVAQHFHAKSVVIGFDGRQTSPAFANAVARGVTDAGADVLDIGMAGTEEMYWAVTEFGACAGIEVTASHNPINYNGIKIVKSGSRPLNDASDFQAIRALAGRKSWANTETTGKIKDFALRARDAYVRKIISFIDPNSLVPLKIAVNSGNGAAGPTLDAVIEKMAELNAPIEFIRINHEPDSAFPNGIPNPLLRENHAATADVVLRDGADIGVAFDGDFDRCFLFDGFGRFVPGEYVVGLLASAFIARQPGAKIVHEPRVIWNTQDAIASAGGVAIASKTGHAFMKQAMRDAAAVYGGEMSAHHYFKDFAYCDSGMIPWLMIAELLSRSGHTLAELVSDRSIMFPSSGELNFTVDDASNAISRVLSAYQSDARSFDETDGISLTFNDWRFNLRKSNTEPLVRLNVEARGITVDIHTKIAQITEILGGTRA